MTEYYTSVQLELLPEKKIILWNNQMKQISSC